MDIATALRVLGLEQGADWNEVRNMHREAIRRSHPDVGGSTDRAAQLNQALGVLERATNGGQHPLPPPVPDSPSSAGERLPSAVFGSDSPAELLCCLADVGHDVGEVVFVDSGSGRLEIIVGPEPGVGRLIVEVGEPTHGGISVAFTLESLGVLAPPWIGEVVADLLRLYDARQSTDITAGGLS